MPASHRARRRSFSEKEKQGEKDQIDRRVFLDQQDTGRSREQASVFSVFVTGKKESAARGKEAVFMNVEKRRPCSGQDTGHTAR